MFTVLRFCGLSAEEIPKLARQLDTYYPGKQHGEDRVPGRLSISLGEHEDWSEHLDAIGIQLERLDCLIAQWNAGDHTLELDIAIWPEDYKGRFCTNLDFSLPILSQLAQNKVAVNLSLYDSLPDVTPASSC